MGKKGTKRKTRWRALPLGEEDGGSGNEEELLDEDQSTTSSVAGGGGQATNNYRSNPALFRMGEKPYRQARRFPYDKFRHREPLIKLESKTFDEEEYTKITTPRQDVLFKKGYFGKKRESSVEEIIQNNTEMEGEETVMDQIIITNGFVDERGHYLVNGSSYEIYDPYTNTVTVVVGPPPYANGVSPPVLAAVSCQPVPLQPVDWYPPGTEWPNQGTAWTPTYHQTPHSDSVSSPGQSCESTPTSLGSEGQNHNMYHHPSYIPLPHGYVYGEPPVYNVNGVSYQDSANSTTEVMCSKGNSLDQKLMKTRRKSEESTTNEKETATESDKNTQNNIQSTAIETTKTSTSIQNSNSSLEDNKKEQNGTQTPNSNSTNEEQDACTVIETKHVEKQSHSTQTNLLETQKLQDNSIQVRVKESHSTQTAPEETSIPNNKKCLNNKENEKNEANRSMSEILLSSLTKSEQEPKVPTKPVNNNFNVNNYNNNKMKDYHKTSPKKSQEESPRRIYQKRTNFSDERNKLRVENGEKRTMRSIETSPIKTSYAKKVMNGLENGNAKVMNGSIQMGNVKKPVMNGSNTVMNGSNGVMNGGNSVMNGSNSVMNGSSQNVNKTPLINGSKESVENKKNQNNSKGKSYERPRFNRSLSNGKNSKEVNAKEKKVQSDKIPDKVESSKEVSNESRNHSEKSSTVSELSSPTELSSGQNTPPEKLIVKKMEQKIANEINKSFEEKLKQNLEERKEDEEEKKEVKEIAQEDVEVAQEPTPNTNKNKKQGKKKNKAKEEVKETPKSNKSKKKKKQIDESMDEYDYSNQEIPFLPSFMQRKPDEFLFNGKAQDSDLISDIDSLLTTDDGDILKSLGINEDKLNLSKLPLSSGFLKMLPTFNRDRPKFKFDDYFASTSTKQWQSDLYTKTNITNMKSTKPEEFFASIIENPSNNNINNNIVNNDVVRTDNKNNNKKDGTKNNEKKEIIDAETDKIETAKETNHGAQVIVKKSISIPKTGYKFNKNNLKYKVNTTEKVEVKEEEEEKKNEVEEVKLGIVEAVNSWLQEQGDSEKVLSVNSLPQSFDKIDTDDDCDDSEDQKNVMSNPLNVTSVNDKSDEDDLMRVANKKIKNIRRYRSSSLDAKLSDMKIKKFLTESANYCQDLIGDVKNGLSPNFEFAREELCDPKESVKKYYTLSPSMVPKKKLEESDSENEVFDVLEYKFVKHEGRKLRDGNGNLSDSGVHSDSESCEGKGIKNGIEHQQVSNKEVCNCKLQ